MAARNGRVERARALCNGKTLAFQAKDAGSIPAARSKKLSALKNMVRRDARP